MSVCQNHPEATASGSLNVLHDRYPVGACTECVDLKSKVKCQVDNEVTSLRLIEKQCHTRSTSLWEYGLLGRNRGGGDVVGRNPA